ncbi:MAG: hypothetical protein JWO68_577 [Actinomycetia bacterium]|nr:hypothetical protein [Actinomycetes bacterium]
MTEPDDPTARLEALGRAQPPAPSDDVVAGLTAGRLVRRQPVASPLRRLPVVLPAVAVAAAVLGFVLLAFGSDAPSTVTIRTAADASVQQDDGAAPAAPGQTLTEGDQVITGPAGSVTVGDVTLGPDEVAVVRAGRLRRLRRRVAAATTTTMAPTTTTTVAPVEPVPTTSPPTTAAPPSTTAPPRLAELPASLDLEGRRLRDGSVGLRWTPYEGPDFGAYVVYREDREVVARRAQVDQVQAVDRGAPAVPTTYVVVVLDGQRRPVARSQPIRL